MVSLQVFNHCFREKIYNLNKSEAPNRADYYSDKLKDETLSIHLMNSAKVQIIQSDKVTSLVRDSMQAAPSPRPSARKSYRFSVVTQERGESSLEPSTGHDSALTKVVKVGVKNLTHHKKTMS